MLAAIAFQEPPLVVLREVGVYYRKHPTSQFASTSHANRARGHVAVMERMCRRMLDHSSLLDKQGETLFWCAWAALRRAREKGVPWAELRGLAGALRAVARRKPPGVRDSRYARLVRWAGVRCADLLHRRLAKAGSSWQPPAGGAREAAVAAP